MYGRGLGVWSPTLQLTGPTRRSGVRPTGVLSISPPERLDGNATRFVDGKVIACAIA